jgi:hypothetical protein
MEVARRARVREVSARIRTLGAERVWLWGAGDHTRRVLETPEDLGMPVAGIVDDAPTDTPHRIVAPCTLAPGDHVLISSDWNEDAIWRSSASHRARGVRVHRLYAG